MSGTLCLVLGSMFSSKSTHLSSVVRRYRSIGQNVLVINHLSDSRYGSGALITHDGVREQSLTCTNLCHVMCSEEYRAAQCIVIEEVQFFNAIDAVTFVERACDVDAKHVTMAGLQGDRFRNPWPTISALVPHADSIVHARALCIECQDGTAASFTSSVTDSTDQVLLTRDYYALCRKHYVLATNLFVPSHL